MQAGLQVSPAITEDALEASLLMVCKGVAEQAGTAKKGSDMTKPDRKRFSQARLAQRRRILSAHSCLAGRWQH